jgi:hypothetical protein
MGLVGILVGIIKYIALSKERFFGFLAVMRFCADNGLMFVRCPMYAEVDGKTVDVLHPDNSFKSIAEMFKS